MKSKLLLVMFTIMTCLLAQRSDAQTRYQDSIFASYSISTVSYSSIVSVDTMDIYRPVGDAQAHRPTVVLAHGGTFYTGTRSTDVTVVRLCQDLVKKGYTTVSIDYRLVSNPTNLLDTLNAAVEVFKAISDARAAIRYLYQYADSFGIDTNNIFLGGNSAGAVLGVHYAYADSAELSVNHFFVSALDSIGGTIYGNSGNPGYSSNIKGVISLAGGLNEASWINQCSLPIVSAQGSADPIVPYTCAEPFVFGIAHVPLQLCGLGSYQQYLSNNVPYYESLVFPGAQHVPWDTNAHMYYQVDTLVTGFLYKEVTNAVPTTCSGFPAGVQNVASAADITLFPNPASNVLNIRSSQLISAISVVDEMGRVVVQAEDIHNMSYQLNTSKLSTGIYFVRIANGQGELAAVKKVTID